MDYPIHFADQLRQHLRALRKAQGLTQAGLGQLLGTTQSRVADIEANPGAVSVDQLFRILAALGAEVALRDRRGARAPGSAAPPPTPSRGRVPAGPATRDDW